MKHFKQHLNSAYRKWGKNFYILSIDMKKYFESISHEHILGLLKENLHDERFLKLCTDIISAYGGDKGLGLGSEMNQTYALLCLNEFDHIVKEKFRIKEYGRYMDDMYLILDDKEKLKEIVDFAEEYFAGIGLLVNKKKTQISPIKNGIVLLGFKWRMTDTGHILLIAKKATVTRNKKKLRKLKKKLDSGEMVIKEIENSYASMKGNLKRSNCYALLSEIDRYYNKLFIEEWLNDDKQANDGKDDSSDVYR